jgi:hypothetical protein
VTITPVWLTGFEHGLASPTTNGGGICDVISGTAGTNVAIVTSPVRTGSYALKIAPTTSAAGRFGKNVSGSPTRMVSSFYLYIDTAPSSATYLVTSVTGTSTSYPQLYVNPSTGNFELRRGSGTTVGVGPAYTTGTWLRVDWTVDVSTATWEMYAKIDGGTEFGGTVSAGASDAFTRFSLGTTTTTGPAYVAIYDDVILSLTTADYPVGAHAVLGLRPNSDGTHNAGTNVIEDGDGNDIGTVTAYDHLVESPWTSTAGGSDLIRQYATGTGNYAEINFADTTQTSILGVAAFLQYSSSGTTANEGGCIIRSNTTETTLWGNPTTRADYSESSNFYKVAIVSPDGGAWSQSVVNAIKCRMGYSNNVATYPYWQAIMIEVAYSPGTDTSSTKSAYVKGQSSTSASKSAYIKGQADATPATKSAFVKGQASLTGTKSAFIKGQSSLVGSKPAFIKGGINTSTTKAAFIKGSVNVSSTKSAYVEGTGAATNVSDSKPAYIKGQASITGSKSAYVRGTYGFRISWAVLSTPPTGALSASSSKSAYIKGVSTTSDTRAAFVSGGLETSSVKSAYVLGAGYVVSDTKSAFVKGSTSGASTKSAFVAGGINTTSTKSAYVLGGIDVQSTKSAFVSGIGRPVSVKSAYIMGGYWLSSVKSAYIRGRDSLVSVKSAYIFGGSWATNSKPAFVKGLGVATSTKSAFVFGYTTAGAGDVITLINSTGSVVAWFRVIAEGYGDGTLLRNETLRRNIHGGIDHFLGDVYKVWEMTIKVRHTENDIGYGDLADLETLYSYNNPNGTPSDVITFIDHHGSSRSVKFVGNMEKSLICMKVEGTTAWFIYRLTLLEVT